MGNATQEVPRSRAINAQVRGKVVELFGNQRHAAKRLAAATNQSVRTAEAQLAGKHGFSLEAFVNMVRQIPELRPWAARLLGLEAALDPDFDKELQQLMRAYARKQGWLP